MAQKKNPSTTYEAGTTVHVAPDTLLTDRNIREAKPDTGLVKSIREVGVLEPITAVVTAEGDLRVRYGQRRTHAAREAGRDTVPVYIAGSEHDQDDSAAEAARIIAQRDENTHRQGLTAGENASVVEQLTLLGLSPTQIAKQARISQAEVSAAIAVSGSEMARKAEDRYSDHTEHAECPGHVAWADTDYVNIDPETGQEPEYPDEPSDEATEQEWNAHEEAIARIEGRTRTVQHAVAVYGCEDPKKHGHQTSEARYRNAGRVPAEQMSEEEREKAREQRRLVRANNEAWDSAETVRREWLATFARAKTAPKGTGRFLAEAFSRDSHLMGEAAASQLAAAWLNKDATGYGHADLSPAKSASEARCLVVTLVQVLAYYEHRMDRQTWRQDGTNNAAGRYLRFLDKCGYPLSEVEQYALTSQRV